MADREIDLNRIDEAVLALMFLALHKDRKSGPWRTWKTFDWGAMGRLHEKNLIIDPFGKAQSVVLTDEGYQRCEEAYFHLFTKRRDQAATDS